MSFGRDIAKTKNNLQWCGHEEQGVCGKPFVRACDYHNRQYESEENERLEKQIQEDEIQKEIEENNND